MEKLFCLPYAGGSSLIYYKWRRWPGANLQVVPVEYPGHGRRIDEPLVRDPNLAAEDVITFIRSNAGRDTFSLLGYSLGSALAYEVGLRLQEDPVLGVNFKSVLLCACPAPDQPEDLPDIRSLSENGLLEYTLSLGGTVLRSQEEAAALWQFLPLIRSDFLLYQDLREIWKERACQALKVPAAVFYSAAEQNGIERWDSWISGKIDYRLFEGGHFFINRPGNGLVQEISRFLEGVRNDAAVL